MTNWLSLPSSADIEEEGRSLNNHYSLIGGNTHYGWTDEGPDLKGLFRGSRAGRSWHA